MKVGWSDGQLHKHLLKEGHTEEDMLVRKNDNGLFSSHLAIFPHERPGAALLLQDPAKKKPASPRQPAKKLVVLQPASIRPPHQLEGENDTISVLDAGVTA